MTATPSKTGYLEIDIEQIDSNKKVRADRDGLALLAESIGAVGLLHALVVIRKGQRYEVVAGRNRLAAAKKAGAPKLWCKVIDGGTLDDDAVRLAFIDENVARTELPPAIRDNLFAERAKLIERLRPDLTPKGRMAANARATNAKRKSGARSGGSRRGKSPSDAPKAKAAREAAHRADSASQLAGQLYSEGKLSQTQMDEIVKLPLESQDVIAQASVGKTRDETRDLVKAELERLKFGVPKWRAQLNQKMNRLDDACQAVVLEAEKILDMCGKHNVQSLAGYRTTLTAAGIVLVVESLRRLAELLALRQDADTSTRSTTRTIPLAPKHEPPASRATQSRTTREQIEKQADRLGIPFTNETSEDELRSMIAARNNQFDGLPPLDPSIVVPIECFGLAWGADVDETCQQCPAKDHCFAKMANETIPTLNIEAARELSASELADRLGPNLSSIELALASRTQRLRSTGEDEDPMT